jgi:hypothetical protein
LTQEIDKAYEVGDVGLNRNKVGGMVCSKYPSLSPLSFEQGWGRVYKKIGMVKNMVDLVKNSIVIR